MSSPRPVTDSEDTTTSTYTNDGATTNATTGATNTGVNSTRNGMGTPSPSSGGGHGGSARVTMDERMQTEQSFTLGVTSDEDGGATTNTADTHTDAISSSKNNKKGNRVIDLSNGVRIEFLHRGGNTSIIEGKATRVSNTSPSSAPKRITPFSDVVIDYELNKALDVNGAENYTQFSFASGEALADSMTLGGVYESLKGFETQYVPNYNDCGAVTITALNIAFPYLREGDEVMVFAPGYLGPCADRCDVLLGSDYRPKRLYDEDTGEYIDPPRVPASNREYAEHSFIHVWIRKVYQEIAVTEDRYITRKVLREGKGVGATSNGGVRLNMDEGDSSAAPASAAAPICRQVDIGSVVTFDIGETNEFYGKPLFYKTVKDCLVGGSDCCDELEKMLHTMAEGEYTSFKVGGTRYHIKLLNIQPNTALGEVVGDAATELARTLKDAGNAVLTSSATASTRQFSSPAKTPKNITMMSSPGRSDSVGGSEGFGSNADVIASSRYFTPPSDLTPNSILDALSTCIVRPSRSSYLRCVRPSNKYASGAVVGDTFISRLNDEAAYRALQLYGHARSLLLDADGDYYGDAPDDDASLGSNSNKKVATSSSALLEQRKNKYDFNSRVAMLGTVSGNMSQVYLNLRFYDDAEGMATDAIRRCARADVYKQYFRRAKARRAMGFYEDAMDDLLACEDVLNEFNVPTNDARRAELLREMNRCGEKNMIVVQ